MTTEAPITDQQITSAALKLSRTIGAGRSKVYRAWTDPDAMRKWLAPGTMTITELKVDFRKGGRYFVAMRGSMGAHNGDEALTDEMPVVSAEGTYLEIVPEELVKYTWAGSWNPAEQTVVTVTFSDAPGGTLLQLFHEGFGSQQSVESHNSGWSSSLDKFVALFGGR